MINNRRARCQYTISSTVLIDELHSTYHHNHKYALMYNFYHPF